MRRGKGEDNRMKRDGKTEKHKKEEKGKRGRGIKRNQKGLKQIKSFREDLEGFRFWNWRVQGSKPRKTPTMAPQHLRTLHPKPQWELYIMGTLQPKLFGASSKKKLRIRQWRIQCSKPQKSPTTASPQMRTLRPKPEGELPPSRYRSTNLYGSHLKADRVQIFLRVQSFFRIIRPIVGAI